MVKESTPFLPGVTPPAGSHSSCPIERFNDRFYHFFSPYFFRFDYRHTRSSVLLGVTMVVTEDGGIMTLEKDICVIGYEMLPKL